MLIVTEIPSSDSALMSNFHKVYAVELPSECTASV